MSVPYQRIAVLADPPIDGPAVAVASRAAARIGALELVCVSPNRTVAPIHRAQLERLAAGHGWTPASCTVLVGDASTMLRRHLSRRRRTLVVATEIGTRLATVELPVLVVGASVDGWTGAGPLVVLADAPVPAAALDVAESWTATFGSPVTILDAPLDDQAVVEACELAADQCGTVLLAAPGVAVPGLPGSGSVPILVVPTPVLVAAGRRPQAVVEPEISLPRAPALPDERSQAAATAGVRLRSADTVQVPCPVSRRTSDRSSSAEATAVDEHHPGPTRWAPQGKLIGPERTLSKSTSLRTLWRRE